MPKSMALDVLARHERRGNQLPDLLPFPFKPDDEEVPRMKKKVGTVPRPSKFVPGEMYHSDYDSDFDGPIPVKWRAYASDTEDVNTLRYRKIRPNLRHVLSKPQKRPASPPCPHKVLSCLSCFLLR